MRQALLPLLGASVLALTSAPAHASGFQSLAASARGLGMAHAGDVAFRGADVMTVNPAAIAGEERRNAYFTLSAVDARASAADLGSRIQYPMAPPLPLGGASPVNPLGSALAPSAGVSWRVTRQMSVGLSVDAPFGFDLEAPSNAWLRHQGYRVAFSEADLRATVAFQLGEALSLGAGFSAVRADVRLVSALPNLSPFAPEGASAFDGDGWTPGLSFGAQWRPNPDFILGAAYRIHLDHALGGRLDTTGLLGPLAPGNGSRPATARLSTPSVATLGARWQATDRLSLAAQARWSEWSRFTTIRVIYPGAPPQPRVRSRDTLALAAGAEWAATGRLTLRAGYERDPQAIDGSALLTDADRSLYAAGFSYDLGKGAMLDLALAHIALDRATIDADATAYGGLPVETAIRLTGSLDARANVLSLGLRRMF